MIGFETLFKEHYKTVKKPMFSDVVEETKVEALWTIDAFYDEIGP